MNKDVRRFLRLPLGWRETDEIAGVSPTARDLLVTLVEYCQVRRNGGVMNELQVRTICRTMERGHWALAQLVSAGVLTMSVSEADPPQTLHTPATNPPQTTRVVCRRFVEGLWRVCGAIARGCRSFDLRIGSFPQVSELRMSLARGRACAAA